MIDEVWNFVYEKHSRIEKYNDQSMKKFNEKLINPTDSMKNRIKKLKYKQNSF